MGVLNLTTDSFSDGGELLRGGVVDGDALLARAEAMVVAGASILDLGAESTRPGAAGVDEGLELERIVAALTLLGPRIDAVLSVDSSTPAVFTAAAAAGAGLINDVRALQRPGALAAAAATGLPLCLMHMQGEPGGMQVAPHYDDVVREVGEFLVARREAALEAGVVDDQILLDPGFGFGKTLDHNLELLARLGELAALGSPLLVGMSRKRMIGQLTGREVDERMAGSVAAAVLAVDRGARIVRAHDVKETVDALRVAAAVAAHGGAAAR
ncbi:MAG TPA: dihydropteroate synthase [Pseudomonadales bacterium]|nr:dihydropteroate synthase [Pseudomonadales bacterium]